LAHFPKAKTDLLIYSYCNGMSAEKRASSGGPFERLGEFTVPDVQEVYRLVYGQRDKKKATPESKTSSFLPHGMETFRQDTLSLDSHRIRELFGLDSVKTAESEEDNGKRCLHLSKTTVIVGQPSSPKEEKDDWKPKNLHEMLTGFIPQEWLDGIDSSLLKTLLTKDAEMTEANAAADRAYAATRLLWDSLLADMKNPLLSAREKRAGFASLQAFDPDLARGLFAQSGEVTQKLVKNASIDAVEITSDHPWVVLVQQLRHAIEDTSKKTADARLKSQHYRRAELFYRQRDRLKKHADFLSLLGAGSLLQKNAPLEPVKELLTGSDTSALKAKAMEKVISDLEDPIHDLETQDIFIRSMLNDFAVNDDILSAYSLDDLLQGYNELLHTAPSAMRDPTTARAMLQQYMSQGRIAPQELTPLLSLNKDRLSIQPTRTQMSFLSQSLSKNPVEKK
jgi:hypothetical protein